MKKEDLARMDKREQLKQDILDHISPVKRTEDWVTLSTSSHPDRADIQAALDQYECVYIPDLGKPIVLDGPLILRSNHHLKVAPNQVMEQAEGCVTCLVRNEHVQSGAFGVVKDSFRDTNMSVEGGIWRLQPGVRGTTDAENPIQGALALILFCCAEQVEVRNLTIASSDSYGVQLCEIRGFVVENIHFDHHRKDGVHVNGPAQYGVIRHLTGADMGDDMVAMNAWDWYTSAMTFGTIDHIIVEDVQSENNELRLLPGQKIFDDGSRVDCDIHHCVLEDISGIYTFKLYAQPNIANAIRPEIHDVSGTVGHIYEIYFNHISFVKITPSGLNGLPVKSLFEICADCEDLHFSNIQVANSLEESENMDLKFINVGPLTAVWKNNSEDPAKWGEVFDPDAICAVDRLYLQNIVFAGKAVTGKENLTREVHLTVNPDYPRTTPRGGTGYGTIGMVETK